MKHWARMRPDESVPDYALRVANDGRVITAWFLIGSAILIIGLLLTR